MENKEKFLSLAWFKSKIETATEKVIENRLDGLIDQMIEADVFEATPEERKGSDLDIESNYVPPYINLKLIGDSLIVVLNDGTILNKPNASTEDFRAVHRSKTVQEVLNIISSEKIKQKRAILEMKVKKIKKLHEGIDLLKQLDDFDVRDNSVYLKGIDRSMPQLLVEKFITTINNKKSLLVEKDVEYQSLKKFWMWCCLNSRPEVADKLYDFLEKNGMKITKEGMFVALRNVVKVEGVNSELIDFISNTYQKVKAVWHRNPVNYRIVDLGEKNYKLEKTTDIPAGSIIGNLSTLYLDLPNMEENRYTDDWSKTFDIRIGQKVNMPIEKCDWSTQDCAKAGLHFAGHTAPYVLCGNTTIFTLINPMKVVGIGEEKGRCYEYLPFMVTTVNEANEIMSNNDFDFLELDEQYAIEELESLEENVLRGFAAETKKYNFNIPALSRKELNYIITSFDKMKETISNRIQKI